VTACLATLELTRPRVYNRHYLPAVLVTMRPESIRFAEKVRHQLRLALVDTGDIVGALSGSEPEPVAQPPGCFRVRTTLAVPRPLDPETAEMRQLEVFLRPVEGGLEVFAVRGLDLEAVGE
jgi:hypothetical protein